MRKYRNIPTIYHSPIHGSRTYDSKMERDRAAELDLLVQAGEIVSWAPQVGFALPGKTRHVIDFLVIDKINEDGSFVAHLEEVKGRETPMGKVKRQQVEEIYGMPVRVIRR